MKIEGRKIPVKKQVRHWLVDKRVLWIFLVESIYWGRNSLLVSTRLESGLLTNYTSAYIPLTRV